MHAAIIDDSPATRAILSKLLSDYGMTVHECPDPLKAPAYLDRHPEVRLILVDWEIGPGGGYDLVRRLRGDGMLAGRRRIVMVTAEAGVDDVTAALEAGIDDYLTKPFSARVVREKLDLLGVLAA
jgi:DNA-binding response OmpR family regulator